MYERATPPRSLEQRREALKTANRRRIVRAEWKQRAKRGETHAATLLLTASEDFESMKVLDVLLAMPKIGRVKANKMLQMAMVSPSKRLGGLSERQRAALISLMPRTSGRRGH